MTEEKIRWISREKRKQAAFVTLLCLSSAIIAFAPRNERRLFTVPELPGGFQTLAAPEETLARSEIFGSLSCADLIASGRAGDFADYDEVCAKGFFAATPVGRPGLLGQPGAVQRLASAATPSAMMAAPVADQSPTALFAQPVGDSPVAGAAAPASDTGSSGGSGGGGPANAQPLPLVPPSAGAPTQQPQQPGPVPEPSTWLMMLGGFGAAGWMMRRRSRAAAGAETVNA